MRASAFLIVSQKDVSKSEEQQLEPAVVMRKSMIRSRKEEEEEKKPSKAHKRLVFKGAILYFANYYHFIYQNYSVSAGQILEVIFAVKFFSSLIDKTSETCEGFWHRFTSEVGTI